MKTRTLCGDLVAAFQYLRRGYQQDEARLSTDVHDRKKQGKIEMPPLHKEKNHCGINQGLEQNAWRGQVTSVLGGLSD